MESIAAPPLVCQNTTQGNCTCSFDTIISHFPSFTISSRLESQFTESIPLTFSQMPSKQEYHVVIRPDAKHLSEVAEGNWGICLESEVSIVVGWCQVTALTASQTQD